MAASATATARSFWARTAGFRTYLGRVAYYSFLVLPPWIWFNANVGGLAFINGRSMYPFLNERYNETRRRDVCWNYKLFAQDRLERGGVVLFRSPYNPDLYAVKRVIGLEGDVVRTKPPYPEPHVRVPAGHVWVEGDGEHTLDSNTYGPISARLVSGRITWILLPWRKFGTVTPALQPGQAARVRPLGSSGA